MVPKVVPPRCEIGRQRRSAIGEQCPRGSTSGSGFCFAVSGPQVSCSAAAGPRTPSPDRPGGATFILLFVALCFVLGWLIVCLRSYFQMGKVRERIRRRSHQLVRRARAPDEKAASPCTRLSNTSRSRLGRMSGGGGDLHVANAPSPAACERARMGEGG